MPQKGRAQPAMPRGNGDPRISAQRQGRGSILSPKISVERGLTGDWTSKHGGLTIGNGGLTSRNAGLTSKSCNLRLEFKFNHPKIVICMELSSNNIQ